MAGLSVKLEFTKAARDDSGRVIAGIVRRTAGGVAWVLAREIKRRVKGRGDVAGQRVPRYEGSKLRFVNAKYPKKPGGEETLSGLVKYPSSAVMHRGTKRGSYDVSGGMWEGLSAVIGATSSSVKFRGRSLGQSFVTTGLTKKGKARSLFFKSGARKGERKAVKPGNALKAAAIFRRHGVNILAPSQREIDAIADGVRITFARGIKNIGIAAVTLTPERASDRVQREIIRKLLSF